MAKKQVDINSFLKIQSSKKGTATSKSSKVPLNDEHGQFADLVYQSIQEAHDAQAIADAKKKEAVEMAHEIYQTRALDGEFSKSINFEGIKTKGIQVGFCDVFQVEVTDEDKLIKELGKDLFNKYFQQERKVTLKKIDNQTLDLLRNKLGDDLFHLFFEVSLSVSCKDDMDRKQFEAPEEVRALIKQIKTSVKLR